MVGAHRAIGKSVCLEKRIVTNYVVLHTISKYCLHAGLSENDCGEQVNAVRLRV